MINRSSYMAGLVSGIGLSALIYAGTGLCIKSLNSTETHLTVGINASSNSDSRSLDELISDFIPETAKVNGVSGEEFARDLQVKVAREIKYITGDGRQKIYPQLSADENQFLPLEEILRNKKGDCKDGFIVMASLLAQKGFKVQGLEVHPDDGKPGHIVVVYQDSETKLYGTAGINENDFNMAIYNNLEDIANHQALKQGWTRATSKIVDVDSAVKSGVIQNGKEPFKMPTSSFKDINLENEYGISFGENEDNTGKIEIEMDKLGYIVSYDGIIIPNLPFIKGMVIYNINFYYHGTERNDARDTTQISLKYGDRFSFMIHSNNQKILGFDKNDRAKVIDGITDIELNAEQERQLVYYINNINHAFTDSVKKTWEQKYKNLISVKK